MICPCCCRIKFKPYSICTSSKKVTNYGPVIPLYFHLYRFATLLCIVMIFSATYNEYLIVKSNLLEPTEDGKIQWSPSIFVNPALRNSGEFGQKWRDWSPYINSITCLVMIICSFLFYSYQHNLAFNIDENGITASDFTVMINNVHEDDPDEMIRDYIYERLNKSSLPNVKIVKINRANYRGNLYRLQEQIENQEDLVENISEQIKKLEGKEKEMLVKKLRQVEDKRIQLLEKKNEYEDHIKNHEDFKYNAKAFVTLSSMKEAEIVLMSADGHYTSLCRDIAMFFFPCCFSKRKPYVIKEAPEPNDIKWKFIGYSRSHKNKTVIISTFIMNIILIFSLLLQLGVKILQKHITEKQGKNTRWKAYGGIRALNFGVSILISFINYILGVVADRLSRYEKHISLSHFYASLAKKIIISQVINSGILAFILFTIPISSFDFGGFAGLTNYLYYIFLTNILLTPIMTLFDPFYFYYKLWKRRGLKNKLKSGEFVPLTQTELNEVFEGPDSHISYRYASPIKWLLMSAFFSFILPIGTFITFFFFSLQIYIDKRNFYRRYKEPKRLKQNLAYELSEYCEMVPMFFSVGNVYFRYIIFKTINMVEVFFLVVSVAIYIIPIRKFYFYAKKKISGGKTREKKREEAK